MLLISVAQVRSSMKISRLSHSRSSFIKVRRRVWSVLKTEYPIQAANSMCVCQTLLGTVQWWHRWGGKVLFLGILHSVLQNSVLRMACGLEIHPRSAVPDMAPWKSRHGWNIHSSVLRMAYGLEIHPRSAVPNMALWKSRHEWDMALHLESRKWCGRPSHFALQNTVLIVLACW